MFLLFILLFTGCDLTNSDDDDDEVAPTYVEGDMLFIGGSIFNGVSYKDLSVNTAVYIVYGSTRKAATVRITTATSTTTASAWWSTTVPENTEYVIEAVANGYVDFTATDKIVDADVLTKYTTVQKDIVMYPETAVEHNRNYQLVSSVTTDTTPGAGSYAAKVTPQSGLSFSGRILDFVSYFSNNVVTGDIASDGTFSIPSEELIDGASYTVYVYGVDGYLDTSTTFTANNSASADLYTISMATSDATETGIYAVSNNYRDGDGTVKDGLSAVTITFSEEVELHPALIADVVDLVRISTSNDDGDATTTTWSGTSTTAASYGNGDDIDLYAPNDGSTYTASSRSSITLSSDFKTITVTFTGTLNADADDSLSYLFDLGLIQVRDKDSEDDYLAVTGLGTVTSVIREVE